MYNKYNYTLDRFRRSSSTRTSLANCSQMISRLGAISPTSSGCRSPYLLKTQIEAATSHALSNIRNYNSNRVSSPKPLDFEGISPIESVENSIDSGISIPEFQKKEPQKRDLDTFIKKSKAYGNRVAMILANCTGKSPSKRLVKKHYQQPSLKTLNRPITRRFVKPAVLPKKRPLHSRIQSNISLLSPVLSPRNTSSQFTSKLNDIRGHYNRLKALKR